MAHILLIEDDLAIKEALMAGLKSYGMTLEPISDAVQGELAILEGNFDAVILDLSLPRGDGMTVLANVRKKGITTPILIVTARDAIANRVAGLNAGADDYLVKPFALDELAARLFALIRRSQGHSHSIIHYGHVSLDIQSRQVLSNDQVIELTAKEIALLEEMLLHPKKIHSRATLEDKIYGWSADIDSNAIEVHIHNLRKKLGTDFILTKRGIGYYLNPTLATANEV